MGRKGWFIVCMGGFLAFIQANCAVESAPTMKKGERSLGACDRLYELQKKREHEAKIYSASEQLLWMKKMRELEEQCILESTKETVKRLQAQLEKDRQRWSKKKSKVRLTKS